MGVLEQERETHEHFSTNVTAQLQTTGIEMDSNVTLLRTNPVKTIE